MIRKQKKDMKLKKKRQTGSFQNISPISDFKATLLSVNLTEHDVIHATRGIRHLSSTESNLHIQGILNAGIIPLLVQNLKCNIYQTSTLIYESTWALTNIASTDCANHVVNAGAIKPLVDLLNHCDPKVREQSAWCLGNIAGEGPGLRNRILNESSAIQSLYVFQSTRFFSFLVSYALYRNLCEISNFLFFIFFLFQKYTVHFLCSLVNLAHPENLSLLGTIVWTISNLCRGKPAPPTTLTAGVIYPLVSLLDRPITEDIMIDVIWAISYLSDGDDQQIELVISSGVTSKLVKLLEYDFKCKKPIIRTLGNFVSGSDSQTQVVLDSGILNQLADLLASPSKEVRKESCWLASNIACGNHEQITKLVRRKKALHQLIANATHDRWDVRKEALWALAHICMSGNRTHALTLVRADGFEPLIAVLALENADIALLVAVLDAIKNVFEANHQHQRLFEEHNGIEYLEELQKHPSDIVYQKVVVLIENYLGVADEEDENLAPETTESGLFGFGFAAKGLASPKELFPNSRKTTFPREKVFTFGRVSTNNYS